MEFSSLNWPYVHNVPHCMKATNLMHLSAAIPGLDPGDIRGNRALVHLCTSETRYMGKDPRDL